MKIKDIHLLAIIVRVFAIYLLINAILSSSDLVLALSRQSWMKMSLSYLIYPLLSLFVALFLLFFPMTVARGILPYADYKTLEFEAFSYRRFFTIAIIILGLYFLIDSLVNMSYWAYLWLNYFNDSQAQLVVSAEQKGGTVATIVEFILSVILIFSANKIVNLLKLEQDD